MAEDVPREVHHLNCGTMNMPGAPLVCHVLLVETANALVLVDAGFLYARLCTTTPAAGSGEIPQPTDPRRDGNLLPHN